MPARAGGNARGLEVGDLPDAGGKPLIHPCVSELSRSFIPVVRTVHLRATGHDRDRSKDLHLDVAQIHATHLHCAGADTVELHGLGVHLPGPGDADVIFRKQLVHGRRVARDGCGSPLLFERDDLLTGVFASSMALRVRLSRHPDGRKQKQAEEGGE
jgi:hypothetical protein